MLRRLLAELVTTRKTPVPTEIYVSEMTDDSRLLAALMAAGGDPDVRQIVDMARNIWAERDPASYEAAVMAEGLKALASVNRSTTSSGSAEGTPISEASGNATKLDGEGNNDEGLSPAQLAHFAKQKGSGRY